MLQDVGDGIDDFFSDFPLSDWQLFGEFDGDLLVLASRGFSEGDNDSSANPAILLWMDVIDASLKADPIVCDGIGNVWCGLTQPGPSSAIVPGTGPRAPDG